VVGTPDDRFGEQVTAARAGAHLTRDELVEFAGQHLARYKRPEIVVWWTSLSAARAESPTTGGPGRAMEARRLATGPVT
jgi:acyl-CoA synthetase (AMP-forming)/AMP-acid ligase II